MDLMRLTALWRATVPASVRDRIARVRQRFDPSAGSRYYSGSGEDAAIISWLRYSGVDPSTVRYVDVGASHPVTLSNTYALYRLGARGVLVEPDPDLAQLLRRVRPRDVVIAAGAAFDERRSASLYRLTTRSYNTFLRDHADATVAGQCERIEDAINVPLIPLNEIISSHPPAPHVLSIDAEGVDLEILKSLNLDLLARDRGPCFICVEGSVGECWRILEPAGFEVMARMPTNWIFMRPPRA